MRIYDAGDGVPLIVIPGVQGRWEWMRPALDSLRTRCRTISYSLCGDFRSGCRLDPSAGFDAYVGQLDALFKRLDLGRAAICGVSYGGLIALRYAATRPGRVSSLVIASSPAPDWEPNALQRACIENPVRSTPRFVLTSPGRLWPELRTAYSHPIARVAFLVRHGLRVAAAPMNPPVMASRVRLQQAGDFTNDCRGVTAPTLVVTGEPGLDRIVPVESTMRYLSLIDGAAHAVVPRTGHLGLVTQPERFTSIVADFITHAPAH